VTMHLPDGGPPVAAQLETMFHMLWRVNRNPRSSGRL
jgi:hypothetical protein